MSVVLDPSLAPPGQTLKAVKQVAGSKGLTILRREIDEESGHRVISIIAQPGENIPQAAIDAINNNDGVLTLQTIEYPVTTTFNFDTDTVGQAPADWSVITFGGGTGTGKVIAANPASGANSLRLRHQVGGSFGAVRASLLPGYWADLIDQSAVYAKFECKLFFANIKSRTGDNLAPYGREAIMQYALSGSNEFLDLQPTGLTSTTDMELLLNSGVTQLEFSVGSDAAGYEGTYRTYTVEMDLLGGRRKLSVDGSPVLTLTGLAPLDTSQVPQTANLQLFASTQGSLSADESDKYYDDVTIVWDNQLPATF